MKYDFQKIGEWMERHMAKRAGMVADDITRFVDDNLEKVIVWHELEEKELNEQSLKENYDDLMHFVQKGEDEIQYLMERSASGEMVVVDPYSGEAVEIKKPVRQNAKDKNIIAVLAVIALVLLIAYRIGERAFTYTFVGVAIGYTIILAQKSDRGEVKLFI